MRLLFGAIVAFVLLGLYATSVGMAIRLVLTLDSAAADAGFTEGMRLAMSTIGGLVSTLVVATLAYTKPGETPVSQLRDELFSSVTLNNIVIYSVYAYILIWIVLGLTSFVVGVMMYPKHLQPLTDHGSTWLGIAVSAAYAYFGIKPQDREPTTRASGTNS